MTPKEKAKELVQKYAVQLPYEHKGRIDEGSWLKIFEYNIDLAKHCALIAVQELIDQCHGYREIDLGMSLDYWEEVKQEIEKL